MRFQKIFSLQSINVCLLTLALFLVTTFIQAQTEIWSFTNDSEGANASNCVAYDEAQDLVYYGGYYTNNDIISTFTTEIDPSSLPPVAGGFDGYLVQTDGAGNFMWGVILGSSGNDEITDVTVGSDGRVYITGYYRNNLLVYDAEINITPLAKLDTGDADIFVACFSQNGVLQWIHSEGGDFNDHGIGITDTEDGIALAVYFNAGSNTFGSDGNVNFQGSSVSSGYGKSDFALLKYDYDGNGEWYVIGGSWQQDFEHAQRTFQTQGVGIDYFEGNIYVMSSYDENYMSFKDDSGSFIPGAELHTANDSNLDMFVLNIQTTGTINWLTSIVHGNSDTYGYGIAADCDGVYVGGHMSDYIIYNETQSTAGTAFDAGGRETHFVGKLGIDDGSVIWHYQFDPIFFVTDADSPDNCVMAIDTDHQGNVFWVGRYENFTDVENIDAMLVRMDLNGNIISSQVFGSALNPGFDGFTDIYCTSTGDMYVSGFNESHDVTVDLVSTPVQNTVIKKLNSSTVELLNCCPNDPIGGTLTSNTLVGCQNADINLSIAGYNGSILWQVSTNNGTSYNDISGANTEDLIYSLTENVLIRVKLTTECGVAYSNILALVVIIENFPCPPVLADLTPEINPDCVYILPDYTGGVDFICSDWVQTPPAGTAVPPGTTNINLYNNTDGGSCNFDIDVKDSSAPNIYNCTNVLVPTAASCAYVLPDFNNANANTNINHIVYTFKDGLERIYVNGELASVEERLGGLSNFDPTFYLGMGNEFGYTALANSLFEGSIYLASFNMQALDQSQILMNYGAGPNWIFGDAGRYSTGEIALYTFEEAGGDMVMDYSGFGSPLDLQIQDEGQVTWNSNSVHFDGITMIQSVDVATKIHDAVTSSNEITVEVWVESDLDYAYEDATNLVPRSIVTYSASNVDRNFTLGQNHNKWQVLMRTDDGSTSDNGYPVLNSVPFEVIDNCEFTITQDPVAGTIFNSDTLVNLLVTDSYGNTNSCSLTVTTGLSFNCPEDITVEADDNCQFLLPDYRASIFPAECGIENYDQNPDPNTPIGFGINQIEFTEVGQADVLCSFTINLVDNTAPIIISCQGDTAISVDNTCSYFLEDFTSNLITTDNCSVTKTQTPLPGIELTVGTTVNLVATDANGNSSSCQFVITLVDETAPEVTCPPDYSTTNATGTCGSFVPLVRPVVTAECAQDTKVLNFDGNDNYIAISEYFFDAPQTEITVDVWFKSSHVGSNQIVASFDEKKYFRIHMHDTGHFRWEFETDLGDLNLSSIDPLNDGEWHRFTGTFKDGYAELYVDNVLQTSASLGSTFGTGDTRYGMVGCGSVATTFNGEKKANPEYFTGQISEFRMWDVALTEAEILAIECITTIDSNMKIFYSIEEGPGSSLVNDITGNGNDGYMFGFSLTNDWLDEIAHSCLTYNQNWPDGNYFNAGTTEVTWEISDLYGNTTTCIQEIIVEDIEFPVLSGCPIEVDYYVDENCEILLEDISSTVTATDNCGASIITQDFAPGNYTEAELTELVISAEDINANISTCNVLINYIDTISPIIICPGDITVNTNSGCTATGVSLGSPITSDNCQLSADFTPLPFSYNLGSTIVTHTVSDISGNSASCDQVVTVIDLTLPTISCPSNIVAGLDAGENFGTINVPLPTYGDNCSVATVINDFNGILNASGQYSLGFTTVTWTVTDGSGNENQCSTTIEITDTNPPEITCPANITVNNLLGECGAYVLVDQPIATDNDGISFIINDYNNSDNASANYNVGTTIVNWTAYDNESNFSTCSMEITVLDTESPVISNCFGNQTISSLNCNDVLDDYGAQIIATDNCTATPSLIISQSPVAGTLLVGITTVTITVSDLAGNSTQCIFDVEAVDDTNPTIDCLGDQFESFNFGCGYVIPDYSTIINYGDNCSSQGSITFTQTPIATTEIFGNQIINITIEDESGNQNTCSFTIFLEDQTSPLVMQNGGLNFEYFDFSSTMTSMPDLDGMTPDLTGISNISETPTTLFNSSTYALRFYGYINITAAGDYDFTINSDDGSLLYIDESLIIDHNGLHACTSAVGSINLEIGFYPIEVLYFQSAGGRCLNLSYSGPGVAYTLIPDAALCFNYTYQDEALPVNENCEAIVPDYSTYVNYFDNCSLEGDILVEQTPAPGEAITITQTVLLDYTDQNANVTSFNFEISLDEDYIDPVIVTCASDATVFVDSNCQFQLQDYTGLLTVTDNCSTIFTYTQSPGIGSIISGDGTVQTVSITVYDENLNSSFCTFELTLDDNIIPTITCPSDASSFTNTTTCESSVNLGTPVTNDNCFANDAINDWNGTNNGDDVYPGGITEVVWTVSDASGNTNTCSHFVTVIDNDAPSINCPSNATYSTSSSSCDVNLVIDQPIVNDNCALDYFINNKNSTDNASGLYNLGTTSVLWTVYDMAGNSQSCSHTITVVDDVNPIIDCPNDTIIANDLGFCSGALTIPTPTISDNCGILGVSNNINGSNELTHSFPLGQTSVVWTVSDVNSNSTVCTQLVTVQDLEGPILNCQTDLVFGTDPDLCSANLTLTPIGATDNCGGPITLSNNKTGTANASGIYNIGETTVIWLATDQYGNTNTCEQLITINDTQSPDVVGPGDQTETVDGNCEFTMVSYTGITFLTTSDNCDSNLDIVQTPSEGTVISGTTPVTISVTDDANNTTNWVFNVIVEDTEAPVIITCTPEQTVQVDEFCEYELAFFGGLVDATDNCDLSLTVTQSPIQNSTFTVDDSPVLITLTVSDDNGNSTDCTFNLIIEDNPDYTITCPSDVNASIPAIACEAFVSIGDPSIADYCGNTIMTNSISGLNDPSGNYGVGTFIIEWDIEDDMSTLLGQCSQTITVIDTLGPVINCPADVTVDANINCNYTDIISLADPVINHNCSYTLYNDTYDYALQTGVLDFGLNTIIWTVEDDLSNTSTCTQLITVEDNTNPTTVWQDATLQLDVFGNATLTSAMVDNGSYDNCAVDYQTISQSAFDCSHLGPNSVLLTTFDINGNQSSSLVTVTVEDNVAPVALCQDFTLNLLSDGTAFLNKEDIDNGSFDACSVVDLMVSLAEFDCTDIGINPVTLTVSDDNGNESTCVSNVNVVDLILPTANCHPTAELTLDEFGSANISLSQVNNISFDACGISSYSISPNSFDCSDIGVNTVVLTIIDANNNSNTCSTEVNVSDSTIPTITCPDDLILAMDVDNCYATPGDLGLIEYSDECSAISVSNDSPVNFIAGNTVVTWETFDQSGNTATCTQNVFVADETYPTAICGDFTISLNGSGTASIDAVSVGIGSLDNCTIDSYTLSQTEFTDIGIYSVDLIVTDVSGLADTCVSTITVQDQIAPTALCQSLTIYLDEFSSASITALEVDNGSYDNDGIVSYSLSQTEFGCEDLGSIPVTLTVTDTYGNSANCSSTITVKDIIPPTVTCSGDISQPNGMDSCSAYVFVEAPIIEENCDYTFTNSYNLTNDASDVYPVGETTVTWTVTDSEGNIGSCSQLITVTDDQNPIITCNTPIAAELIATTYVINPNNLVFSYDDNCAIDASSLVLSQNILTVDNLGSTFITVTISDFADNIGTCISEIILVDNGVPDADCVSSLDVLLDGTGNASITPEDIDDGSSDSSGGDVSLSLNQTEFDCTDFNTNEVTLTVEDLDGNIQTCTSTINIIDPFVPEIICPANQTMSATLDSCNAYVTVEAPIVDDNCPDGLVFINDFNNTTDGSDFYSVGTTDVLWTVSDLFGNDSTCVQSITITDDQLPIIDCVDLITVSLDSTVFVIDPVDLLSSYSDNCGLDFNSFVTNVSELTVDDIGPNAINLSVNDVNGNPATCPTFVLVLVDDILPTASCIDSLELILDSDGLATITTDDIDDGSFDSSGTGITLTLTQDTFDCTDYLGTTTTLEVEDQFENLATCNTVITLVDLIEPTITCPDNISTFNDPGSCGALLSIDAPIVDDNCISELVWTNDYNNTSDASDYYNVDTIDVTWTVVDPFGLSATCVQSIIVQDNENPIIVCEESITVSLIEDSYTLDINEVFISSSDNCEVNDSTLAMDAGLFTTSNLGINVVNITVEDIYGNEGTCQSNVDVVDSSLPIPICIPELDIYLDSAGGATITAEDVDSGSYDTSGGEVTLSIDNTDITCSDLSGITVELTVTDPSSNFAVCETNITVLDTLNPFIVCPDDITIPNTLDSCGAFVNINNPFVFDNCPIGLTYYNDYTFTGNASSYYPGDTTIITWILTDGSSNSNSCTQTIVVLDEQVPTVECIENLEVELIGSSFTLEQDQLDIVYNDNCAINESTLNFGPTSFDFTDIGLNNIGISIEDIAGNIGECITVMNLVDLTPPEALCVDTVFVDLDMNGLASITLNDVNDGSFDTSTGSVFLTLDTNEFDCSDYLGSEVIMTVTDPSSNSSTCTSAIVVNDSIDPTITCPDNVETVNDLGLCGADLLIGLPSVDDNCTEGLSWSNDFNMTDNASGMYLVDTTSVLWTVVDQFGNSGTCTQTIIVEDTESPVIECVESIVVELVSESYSIEIGDLLLSTNDNCEVDLSTQELDIYELFESNLGPNDITLSVEDIYGNIGFCVSQIILEDNGGPVAECVDTLFVDLDMVGFVSIIPEDINDGSYDSSGGDITFELNEDEFGCLDWNSQIVTLTVYDESANPATCIATVIVSDPIAPEITCPEDITRVNDAGICGANVVIDAPEFIDNCPAELAWTNDYNFTSDASDLYFVDTTYVVWTGTDAFGNFDQCTQMIIITDTESPSILCQDDVEVELENSTVELDPIDILLEYNDNCAVNETTLTIDPTELNEINLGINTVTISVEDIYGNINSCETEINLVDLTNPIALCVDTLEVTLNTFGEVSISTEDIDNGSYDSSGGEVSLQLDNNIFNCESFDGVQVTLTATDESGNTDECISEIIVMDLIAPIVQCPDTTQVTNDPGLCGAELILELPDVIDNCHGQLIWINDYNDTNNASDLYTVGTTTVEWTITDPFGNFNVCSQTIIVSDTESPIIECIESLEVELTSEIYIVDPIDFATLIDDNCWINPVSLSADIDTLTIDSIGTIPFTISVSDLFGNPGFCSTEIVLVDTTAPINVCNDDITISLDSAGMASIMVEEITFGSYDATGSEIFLTPNEFNFDCADIGDQDVVVEITDMFNNTSFCEVVIIVNDTILPSIDCGDDIVQYSTQDSCETFVQVTSPEFWDNCMDDINITNDFNNFDDASDVYPVGTTPVIWNISDESGNFQSCIQQITVLDTISPVINCIDTITENLIGETFVIVPNDLVVNITDNCSFNSEDLISDIQFLVEEDLGLNEIILSIEDINGNIGTCITQINLVDGLLPVANCQDTLTYYLPEDAILNLNWEDFDDGSYDPLLGDLTYDINPEVLGCSNLGTNSIFLTVTTEENVASTCSTSITVVDTIAPTVYCQDIDIVLNDDGEYYITPSMINNGSYDVCNQIILTLDNNYFNCENVGDNTVILTGQDSSGNPDSCTANVNVVDETNPEIEECDFVNSFIASDIMCGDSILISELNFPSAEDACGLSSIVSPYINDIVGMDINFLDYEDQLIYFPVDATVGMDWIVTDMNENYSECASTFEMLDQTAPFLVDFPLELVLMIEDDACAIYDNVEWLYDYNVDDNCEINWGAVEQIQEYLPVGGIFTGIPQSNGWVINDIYGNFQTVFQQLYVIDTIAPIITCADTLTYYSTALECGVMVEMDPSDFVTDNCTENLTLSSNFDENLFPGTYNFEWTVTDSIIQELIFSDDSMFPLEENEFGQAVFGDSIVFDYTSTCNQIVMVVDTIAPWVVENENYTIVNTDDSIYVEISVPIYEDNCDLISIVPDVDSDTNYLDEIDFGDFYENGTYEIIWTITDINGNVLLDTTTINVIDEGFPTIGCFDDMVIEMTNCEYIVPDYSEIMSYSDILTPTEDLIFTQFPMPETVVTANTLVQISVEDEDGFITQCEFLIELVDSDIPDLICPETYAVCSTLGNFDFIEYSDECSDVIEIQLILDDIIYENWMDASTIAIVENTQIEFFIEDSSGNENSCLVDLISIEEGFTWETIPESICNGESLDIITTASNYTWETSNENSTIEDGIFEANLDNGSDQTVTITLSLCDNVYTQDIIINSYPEPEILMENQVCGNQTQPLVTGNFNYTSISWTCSHPEVDVVPNDEIDAQLNITAIDYEQLATSITLFADNNGCSGTATIDVIIDEPIFIEGLFAGEDQVLFDETETNLDGWYIGTGSTMWLVSDESDDLSVNFDNATNPTTSVSDLGFGNYELVLEASNGVCPAASDTLNILINGVIPNGFSPNDNGVNDFFVIEGLKESADSELMIFNRWGSEVYSKVHYDNSWNGTNKNGEMLIEDTYFYVLRLGNKSFEGFVILKRN